VYKRDLNNFAPFFGFTWDPRSNGRSVIRGGFATHFTQDGFTLYQLASTGNTGLFTVATNSTPTGVFGTPNPPPATPVASFPVSQRNNFNNISNASNIWYFNSNLRTPYVLEWNLSIQKELWKRFAIEARYVGNHAPKQLRAWTIDEIDFLNNGLL